MVITGQTALHLAVGFELTLMDMKRHWLSHLGYKDIKIEEHPEELRRLRTKHPHMVCFKIIRLKQFSIFVNLAYKSF